MLLLDQMQSINSNHIKKNSNVNNTGPTNRTIEGGKSVLLTYIFWLFGGLFGAHHFYLRRDKQAFLWATTFGGYFGIGWLGDIFKIKRYVQDANDDPVFIEYFIQQLRKYKKPPFSTNRFIGQLMVGYFWAQLVLLAVPEEEFGEINWKFLNWLSPLACGLGAWFVGNIGRQKGSPWLAILAAYVAYQARWYIYDETMWLTIMSSAATLTFDTFSKEWNRKPPKKRGFIRRVIVLSICFALYMSLWGSYLYFNGKITDSDGEEIPVYEAINHFFRSPWWTDIKSAMFEIWDYAQHHGWYEIWKQIIEISDPSGENNAYRVLDVSPESSQSEITAKWRKLSKEWHPDKVKDEEQKRIAQEKFMEIQQAYEILSKVKNKRQRRNKQSI